MYLGSLLGIQLKLNIAQVCFHQYALRQRATRPFSLRQERRFGFEKLLEERHYLLNDSVVQKLEVNLLSQRFAGGVGEVLHRLLSNAKIPYP